MHSDFSSFSFSSGYAFDAKAGVSLDTASFKSFPNSAKNKANNDTKKGIQKNLNFDSNHLIQTEKPKKEKEKKRLPKQEVRTEKAPVFDYTLFADKLVGFAIIVFVDASMIKQVEHKIQTPLDFGKVIVIRNKVLVETFDYIDYSQDMDQFFTNLRTEIIGMPKRKHFVFGDVLFHSDAKLKDYHTKRHETNSLEEQCDIYRLELDELRQQVKELSQHHTDMQQTAETLRTTQKKVLSLQEELENKSEEYEQLRKESEQKQKAYQNNASIISFYKEQIETASRFPTYKEDVCDWIDKQFSDTIILTPRAKSEMKKYSGSLDLVSLCDGIVYIDAYARYRSHAMDEDTLNLYAERKNWEVQNCGKEAIRVRKSDYTVTYNNTQYLLDLHIKHGIKQEELIRIYFCWNESLKKIIIGSMPEHLATVKQNT